MTGGQLDLFDMFYEEPTPQSELEEEVERLKALLQGYVMDENTSVAGEKLLMIIVKRMGRYLSESKRRQIILSSFYTLCKDTEESIFEDVLNSYIHAFDLKCHDWDEYYAERKGQRPRKY